MSDIVIRVSGVSKNFRLPHQNQSNSIKSLFLNPLNIITKKSETSEVQHALKDISFEIKKGEFFGIVGRNGSGKSTLLKILAGIYQPTSGKVEVRGKLVPFIELGVGFNPELTGRENIFLNGALLGFSRSEITAMYEDIVAFAELEKFMDQRLKNYSSGMQVRLAFSMAVRANADILLIDEVLAVGDADFQRKCFDYFKSLKKNKKTVVFVSHDMDAVREYCDRAILIDKSQIVLEENSTKVAQAYRKLFAEAGDGSSAKSINSKRWGDQSLMYKNVEVSLDKLRDNKVIIKATVKVNKTVDQPIFGFTIKDAAGNQLVGTNSKIKRIKIDKADKKDEIKLTWEVPNIFSKGSYSIDPAIVYNNGPSVSDWWEDAATFRVQKQENTTYLVSPDVNVIISSNGVKLEPESL